MDSSDHSPRWGDAAAGGDHGSRRLIVGVLLLLMGFAVGFPALDAGFLGGDDEQLILNHALVNHPSFEHALKLFRIVHRDLYQPIPLLTFQLEIALYGQQGANAQSLDRLLFGMHATNVLIHALNGILVWLLVSRLAGRETTGVIAAVLFLVHPLAVECYAWLNGRMLMLSTFFILVSLNVFDRDLTSATASQFWGRRLCTVIVVCAALALAMMCKVQPTVSILFVLILAWRHSQWPSRGRVVLVIVLATVLISALFTWVNWEATRESRMFEGAEQQLSGPNLARVLLAVGWYFSHYVVPVGLAPWYAPPATVSYSDSNVLLAAAVCIVVIVGCAVSLRCTRVGVWGLSWFLFSILPTLPFIPSRNLLVADRYTYLPIVGLHVISAYALYWFVQWLVGRLGRQAVIAIGVMGSVALVGLLAMSWSVSGYYHDDLARVQRIEQMSPAYPTLPTSVGWIYYQMGQYPQALARAEEELTRFGDHDRAYAKAMNLRAMARYKMGAQLSEITADLLAGIERDPSYIKNYHDLGLVRFRAGQYEAAIEVLEQGHALEDVGAGYNPLLKLLAHAYRKIGNLERAGELYQQALDNSRGYDIEAIEALGEIDIRLGRYEQAIKRYEALLKWDQRSVSAGINLAVAYAALGRPDLALPQCRRLLRDHPASMPALVFSTRLMREHGLTAEAEHAWARAAVAAPESDEIRAWWSLYRWYARDAEGARKLALAIPSDTRAAAIAEITLLMTAVSADRADEIVLRVQALWDERREWAPENVEYLLEATEFHSEVDARSPWPYYVAAVGLLMQDRTALAEQFRKEFEKRDIEQQWCDELDGYFRSGE